MKAEKLVSVIIAVYNAEKYIKDCIDSVLEQSYSNIEIILVDDGSTDGTCAIYETYKKHRCLKIIRQENQGVSAARNTGIEYAKGHYTTFIDADDYIDKNYILSLVNILQEYDAEMSICNAISVDEHGREKKLKQHDFRDRLINRNAKFNFCKNHFASSVWGKLFIKELIGNNRFCDIIRIGEDSLFVAQYIKGIKKISYADDVSYYYRKNSDSVMHEEYSDKKLDELRAWRKIEELYADEKFVWKTCRLRYLKVCKRIGTMLHKQDISNKAGWKPYCDEIKSNIRIVFCSEDYLSEKIKLLLFAFLPKIHYLLFEIKNS